MVSLMLFLLKIFSIFAVLQNGYIRERIFWYKVCEIKEESILKKFRTCLQKNLGKITCFIDTTLLHFRDNFQKTGSIFYKSSQVDQWL